MNYRARVYICADYMGYIDCDHWELKKKPYALYFYDKTGKVVGHVEPFGDLIARVDIYQQTNPELREEGYILAKQYAFRHKGCVVLANSREQWRKMLA